MADGRTAWSQPFWLTPNAPQVILSAGPRGLSISGQTIPGARVHISDRGRYLGSAVAQDDGGFTFLARGLAEGEHDLWVMATSPWPDQLESPATLMSWTSTESTSTIGAIGRWIRSAAIGSSG
jgi:hypothetical protein